MTNQWLEEWKKKIVSCSIGRKATMKFINPKVDYAFKKIFGSEQSKEILISFLNAIIYDGEKLIASLTIINPFNPGMGCSVGNI